MGQENSARRGHDYEINVVRYLKKYNFVPAGFMPAASENRPDIKIQNSRGQGGCELKISTKVGGGSVNFIHDRGKWKFETKYKLPEQQFLIKVAKKAGFFDLLQQNWKELPLKRTPNTKELEALTGSMTKEQIYRVDLANFTSFSFKVDPRVLEKYYVEKKAQYINVGTHGLYVLGTSDPLGMNKSLVARRMKKVPRFASVANMTMQVQVKNKGVGKWHQFMIEGRFTIPLSAKSPYNLGATNGNTSSIVIDQSDISCFL
jgi:hypothetical protein